MIELRRVSKVYGKKASAFRALDDVSLTVDSGSTVAIVGKSGSGKSTLMHVMSGLDPATAGVVMIGGKDISKMKTKQVDLLRSKTIGFIFQSFFVEANQSVVDNVSLPLEIAKISRSARRKRALEAIKLVELDEKITQKARNLSGGQKQRLAIARAIVNRPKIIFADEPTGNLDSKTGDTIVKLLFRLNKDYKSTLIIVTHDLELAAKCKVQIHMKDGKIEEITNSGRVKK